MKQNRQQRSRHAADHVDLQEERRSCRILLKTVDGATHDLEVECLQGGNLFQSFQVTVEQETRIPRSKQRFFTGNGTQKLSTVAHLNSALKASEEAGEVLIVQVLPKTIPFVTCEEHPCHTKTVFCVSCRRFLCFKCLITHVSNGYAHNLADLEDGSQFMTSVATILQQADQGLKDATSKAASNKNYELQKCTASFDRAFAHGAIRFSTGVNLSLQNNVDEN